MARLHPPGADDDEGKAGIVIDERGRLFGRINVVDGLVASVVLLLIPLAYATYLLFTPAVARIESVTEAPITKAEERISIGGNLVAKFKVKGSGFTPLMRARIDGIDALAFVFESPTSADVLVGGIPPGPHDLILYDGIQEVARAAGSISVTPPATASVTVRAVGWITGLTAETVAAMKPGDRLGQGGPEHQLVALGPVVPGFRRLSIAGSVVYAPEAATRARRAVILLGCNDQLAENPCAFGLRFENRTPPVSISIAGPTQTFGFAIEEILPSTPPARATLRVRLASGMPQARAGDRDNLLDERAAVVTAIAGDALTLEAGVDPGPQGWLYRGQRLVPGAELAFATERYALRGTVLSVDVQEPAR